MRCHAPLQAGHPVTTTLETVFSKAAPMVTGSPGQVGRWRSSEAVILRAVL